MNLMVALKQRKKNAWQFRCFNLYINIPVDNMYKSCTERNLTGSPYLFLLTKEVNLSQSLCIFEQVFCVHDSIADLTFNQRVVDLD